MVRRLNKYWKQAARGESGFTLVEQIVTVAIVGLVLTAAMAALATGALGLNVATSKNQARTTMTRGVGYFAGVIDFLRQHFY